MVEREEEKGHRLVWFFFRSLSSTSTSSPCLFAPQKPPKQQAGPSWRAVLRKKPPGVTLPSAHAVEREAALFLGLGESSSPSSSLSSSSSPSSFPRVPVPRVLALETSSQPLGTPFYVMEFVAGRVFTDPALPGLEGKSSPTGRGRAGEDERRRLYEAAAEALARIHSVDVAASPRLSELLLSRKGRGNSSSSENVGVDYCARQIRRWERQYLAQAGPGKKRPLLPEMLELISFLKAHVPRADSSLEDSGGRPTLVHGDFRIDNLVFDCAFFFSRLFFLVFSFSLRPRLFFFFFLLLAQVSFFPLRREK